jgi:hypothetical protein
MQTLTTSPFTNTRLKPSQIAQLATFSRKDANSIIHRTRAGQPTIELFDILPSPYKAIVDQAVASIEFDTPFIKVIEGGYGAGKTTLIQQILRRIESFRDETGRAVPVFTITLGQSLLHEARLWQLLLSDCDQNLCASLVHAMRQQKGHALSLQHLTARADVLNLSKACSVLARNTDDIDSDVVELYSAFDNYRSKNRTQAFKQVAARIINRCEHTEFSQFAGGTNTYIEGFKTFYMDLIKIMRSVGVYPFFVFDEAEVMLTQTPKAQVAMQEFVRELFDLAVEHQFGFIMASTPAYTAEHLLAHDALRGRLSPANRHATSSRSAIVSLDYDRDSTLLLCETITCVYLLSMSDDEDRAGLFDFIANNSEAMMNYLDTECRGHNRIRMVGRTCVELLDYVEEFRALPKSSMPPPVEKMPNISTKDRDHYDLGADTYVPNFDAYSGAGISSESHTDHPTDIVSNTVPEDKTDRPDHDAYRTNSFSLFSISGVNQALGFFRKNGFRFLNIERIVNYGKQYMKDGSREGVRLGQVIEDIEHHSSLANSLCVVSPSDVDKSSEFIRHCMREVLRKLKYEVEVFIDHNAEPSLRPKKDGRSIVYFDGRTQLNIKCFESFRTMTVHYMIDYIFSRACTGDALPQIGIIPFSILDSVIWDAFARLHDSGTIEDTPLCMQNRSSEIRSHEAIDLCNKDASSLLSKSIETTVSPVEITFTDKIHKYLACPELEIRQFDKDFIWTRYVYHIRSLYYKLSSNNDEFDEGIAKQFMTSLRKVVDNREVFQGLLMENNLLETMDYINFECVRLLDCVPIEFVMMFFSELSNIGTYKHKERLQRHVIRRAGYMKLLAFLDAHPQFKPNMAAMKRHIIEHPPTESEYYALAAKYKLPKCIHFAPSDDQGCSTSSL